jgi:hypothetical protein
MAVWVRNKQTQAIVLVVGEDTVARVLSEPDRYERLQGPPDRPNPERSDPNPESKTEGSDPNPEGPIHEDPELKAMMEPPADWKPTKRTRGSKA